MQGKQRQRPPVQRPMILDVLPSDIAPRLDKKPKSFNKKLINHIPARLRHWWVLAGGVVLIIALTIVVTWRPWQANLAQLPDSVAGKITTFVPYYFTDSIPKGFAVDEHQLSYSDGVLFFEVKDAKNQTVVISEQSLPPSFSNMTPHGDLTISHVDGQAIISTREGRTIGTLITNKEPRALVSLNAADSVSAITMTQIMQALTPASTR